MQKRESRYGQSFIVFGGNSGIWEDIELWVAQHMFYIMFLSKNVGFIQKLWHLTKLWAR